jgi:hypothetical protein
MKVKECLIIGDDIVIFPEPEGFSAVKEWAVEMEWSAMNPLAGYQALPELLRNDAYPSSSRLYEDVEDVLDSGLFLGFIPTAVRTVLTKLAQALQTGKGDAPVSLSFPPE